MGKELKAVRFSKKNVESELLEVVNALLQFLFAILFLLFLLVQNILGLVWLVWVVV